MKRVLQCPLLCIRGLHDFRIAFSWSLSKINFLLSASFICATNRSAATTLSIPTSSDWWSTGAFTLILCRNKKKRRKKETFCASQHFRQTLWLEETEQYRRTLGYSVFVYIYIYSQRKQWRTVTSSQPLDYGAPIYCLISTLRLMYTSVTVSTSFLRINSLFDERKWYIVIVAPIINN